MSALAETDPFQLGPVAVPMPTGARVDASVPGEVHAMLDRKTGEAARTDYYDWALSRGWRPLTQTDESTGWALVLDDGENTLAITCGYTGERALLCVAFEAGPHALGS